MSNYLTIVDQTQGIEDLENAINRRLEDHPSYSMTESVTLGYSSNSNYFCGLFSTGSASDSLLRAKIFAADSISKLEDEVEEFLTGESNLEIVDSSITYGNGRNRLILFYRFSDPADNAVRCFSSGNATETRVFIEGEASFPGRTLRSLAYAAGNSKNRVCLLFELSTS
ncbi:MAG: hypothetical protein AAGC60_17085 [Acidobacteriota bacterium]